MMASGDSSHERERELPLRLKVRDRYRQVMMIGALLSLPSTHVDSDADTAKEFCVWDGQDDMATGTGMP
jgi:hypothetical protein